MGKKTFTSFKISLLKIILYSSLHFQIVTQVHSKLPFNKHSTTFQPLPMSEYQFSFEKLEVWKLARELTSLLYRTTSKFPPDERFGLVSQIRRAAVSVAANIAEGSSRMSPKDQARFTVFSFSSLIEVFNHLTIAKDLGYIDEFLLQDYRKKIQLLSVKLSNYRATQLKKVTGLQKNPSVPITKK